MEPIKSTHQPIPITSYSNSTLQTFNLYPPYNDWRDQCSIHPTYSSLTPIFPPIPPPTDLSLFLTHSLPEYKRTRSESIEVSCLSNFDVAAEKIFKITKVKFEQKSNAH